MSAWLVRWRLFSLVGCGSDNDGPYSVGLRGVVDNDQLDAIDNRAASVVLVYFLAPQTSQFGFSLHRRNGC
jgi:hypothetical protein